MRIKFEQITKSDLKTVNVALVVAIKNSPKEDVDDGLKILALIEEKGWYGKLEYPIPPSTVKCASHIKAGVYHSMAIYNQCGKWRFTRTEFNDRVEFGKGKK